MAIEPHNDHEERREQGCSISAERNSRGHTVSAKVWDANDKIAVTRLKALMSDLEAAFPAKHAE